MKNYVSSSQATSFLRSYSPGGSSFILQLAVTHQLGPARRIEYITVTLEWRCSI